MKLLSTQVEDFLMAALKDEECLTPSINVHVQQIFSQIFFYYPRGLKDQSEWQARDASKYIRNWYNLASMREKVDPHADATEHSIAFSKDQMNQIFKSYMDDMKKNLKPGQEGKTWAFYKSCAYVRMKNEAGHSFLANAIWAIGLPRVPQFATEELSTTDLDAVQWAIQKVLDWLDRVAVVLLNHHATKEYHEAVRKAGVAPGQSGLTATEQETRATNRRAKFDMKCAKWLAKEWESGRLTKENGHAWQLQLLDAYKNGSLEQRVRQIKNADTMCRTPIHSLSSARIQ
jgi:hypothetical protein